MLRFVEAWRLLKLGSSVGFSIKGIPSHQAVQVLGDRHFAGLDQSCLDSVQFSDLVGHVSQVSP